MKRISEEERERFLAASEALEDKTPQEIIAWAAQEMGPRWVLSSSFGADSAALLHMVSEVAPGTRVAFLDTGWHFPETLAFRNTVGEELDLKVIDLVARGGHGKFLADHGELWRHDTDRCCHINKVEPWRRFLLENGVEGWAAGLRRESGGIRSQIGIVEIIPMAMEGFEGRELLKVHPLANWTKQQIWKYVYQHDLPYNPLADQDYGSVGCWPCTRALKDGEDERAGRWSGAAKTECGLHILSEDEGERVTTFSANLSGEHKAAE